MSLLINPTLASCDRCGWEITVGNYEEKKRREKTHAERVHLTSSEAVTALLTDDPSHDHDVATVISAIEFDARANSGEVDPNRVRGLLPTSVQPQVIGATYQTLIRQGRLLQVGWTTNTDRKGRNVGKPCPVYEYRGDL